jgi:adenylate kinase
VRRQQLNLLLFGPQGSGKGTQAKRIAAEHGIPHVSTGDMFRAAIAKQSPLGKRVQPILDAGDLVPDDLTVELIRERLAEPDAANGFVLDGFPRNIAQAEALDELLTDLGRPLTAVLELLVSDRVAAKRLSVRAGQEGRADDRSATIIRRLEIYHRETEPLSEYYRSSGKRVGVPGEGSVEDVWSEVRQALEQAVPA